MLFRSHEYHVHKPAGGEMSKLNLIVKRTYFSESDKLVHVEYHIYLLPPLKQKGRMGSLPLKGLVKNISEVLSK